MNRPTRSGALDRVLLRPPRPRHRRGPNPLVPLSEMGTMCPSSCETSKVRRVTLEVMWPGPFRRRRGEVCVIDRDSLVRARVQLDAFRNERSFEHPCLLPSPACSAHKLCVKGMTPQGLGFWLRHTQKLALCFGRAIRNELYTRLHKSQSRTPRTSLQTA